VPITGGTAVQLTQVPWGSHGVEFDYQVSPDSSTVVYRGQAQTIYVTELFGVPITGGTSVKLNGPLTDDSDVLGFRISPDSNRVAYLADQDSEGIFELYGASIAGDTSVKLSDLLVEGGSVQDDYQISADSGYALYRADQNADKVFELFSVPLDGGDVVRLNAALHPEGDVSAFTTSPDGSQTIYVSDQEPQRVSSLYRVPTGGGTSYRLDDSQAEVGDVEGLRISPDGQRVVYRADQNQAERIELYSVPIDGGTTAKLNGTLVAFGDVQSDYQVSPDSQHVVYRADQDTSGIIELYSVPLMGGTPVRLNPALEGDRDVHSFRISPDSQRIVYKVDHADDQGLQLFSVPITGGVPVTLSHSVLDVVYVGHPDKDIYQISPDGNSVVFLDAWDVARLYSVPITGGTPTLLYEAGYSIDYAISPDGSTVAAKLVYDLGEPTELYAVPINGGAAVRLDAPTNGDMPGIYGSQFRINALGTHVVYIGDQETESVWELYSVPITGGTPVKLNDTLVTDGDVTNFQINPNGTTVIYRADQDTNEMHELYDIPIAGGSVTKISYPPFPSDAVEDLFIITADGRYVFYIINQDADTYRDLYLFAASLEEGTTYQLDYVYAPNNTGFPMERDQFKVGADGHNLAYAVVQSRGEKLGLYAVSLAGGTPQRLDGPLAEGGEVDPLSFQVSPDSQTTVYIADQDTDEVFELYAAKLVPGADLGIAKAVTPTDAIVPGKSITYTLTFSNTGGATATGVVISDTIPAPLSNVTFQASEAILSQTGSVPYRWSVRNLATDEGGAITITGIVSPALTERTIITNTAEIISDVPEDDIRNNSSAVQISVTASRKVCLPLILRGFSK
jgi:uncharacterized repeat protein (TIGR01451 family)